MKVCDLVKVGIYGCKDRILAVVINCKQPVDKYGLVPHPNNYAYDVHLFGEGTVPVFESEIEEFK